MNELYGKFVQKKQGINNSELDILLTNLKKEMNKSFDIDTSNLDLPDQLRTLWNSYSKLNLTGCKYNTFGLNIYEPAIVLNFKNTIAIFGDIDCLFDWFRDIEIDTDRQISVANISDRSLWLCLGCFNEFDYIFIQINKSNKNYGRLKLMTNNCVIENFIDTTKNHFMLDLYELWKKRYR